MAFQVDATKQRMETGKEAPCRRYYQEKNNPYNLKSFEGLKEFQELVEKIDPEPWVGIEKLKCDFVPLKVKEKDSVLDIFPQPETWISRPHWYRSPITFMSQATFDKYRLHIGDMFVMQGRKNFKVRHPYLWFIKWTYDVWKYGAYSITYQRLSEVLDMSKRMQENTDYYGLDKEDVPRPEKLILEQAQKFRIDWREDWKEFWRANPPLPSWQVPQGAADPDPHFEWDYQRLLIFSDLVLHFSGVEDEIEGAMRVRNNFRYPLKSLLFYLTAPHHAFMPSLLINETIGVRELERREHFKPGSINAIGMDMIVEHLPGWNHATHTFYHGRRNTFVRQRIEEDEIMARYPEPLEEVMVLEARPPHIETLFDWRAFPDHEYAPLAELDPIDDLKAQTALLAGNKVKADSYVPDHWKPIEGPHQHRRHWIYLMDVKQGAFIQAGNWMTLPEAISRQFNPQATTGDLEQVLGTPTESIRRKLGIPTTRQDVLEAMEQHTDKSVLKRKLEENPAFHEVRITWKWLKSGTGQPTDRTTRFERFSYLWRYNRRASRENRITTTRLFKEYLHEVKATYKEKIATLKENVGLSDSKLAYMNEHLESKKKGSSSQSVVGEKQTVNTEEILQLFRDRKPSNSPDAMSPTEASDALFAPKMTEYLTKAHEEEMAKRARTMDKRLGNSPNLSETAEMLMKDIKQESKQQTQAQFVRQAELGKGKLEDLVKYNDYLREQQEKERRAQKNHASSSSTPKAFDTPVKAARKPSTMPGHGPNDPNSSTTTQQRRQYHTITRRFRSRSALIHRNNRFRRFTTQSRPSQSKLEGQLKDLQNHHKESFIEFLQEDKSSQNGNKTSIDEIKRRSVSDTELTPEDWIAQQQKGFSDWIKVPRPPTTTTSTSQSASRNQIMKKGARSGNNNNNTSGNNNTSANNINTSENKSENKQQPTSYRIIRDPEPEPSRGLLEEGMEIPKYLTSRKYFTAAMKGIYRAAKRVATNTLIDSIDFLTKKAAKDPLEHDMKLVTEYDAKASRKAFWDRYKHHFMNGPGGISDSLPHLRKTAQTLLQSMGVYGAGGMIQWETIDNVMRANEGDDLFTFDYVRYQLLPKINDGHREYVDKRKVAQWLGDTSEANITTRSQMYVATLNKMFEKYQDNRPEAQTSTDTLFNRMFAYVRETKALVDADKERFKRATIPLDYLDDSELIRDSKNDYYENSQKLIWENPKVNFQTKRDWLQLIQEFTAVNSEIQAHQERQIEKQGLNLTEFEKMLFEVQPFLDRMTAQPKEVKHRVFYALKLEHIAQNNSILDPRWLPKNFEDANWLLQFHSANTYQGLKEVSKFDEFNVAVPPAFDFPAHTEEEFLKMMGAPEVNPLNAFEAKAHEKYPYLRVKADGSVEDLNQDGSLDELLTMGQSIASPLDQVHQQSASSPHRTIKKLLNEDPQYTIKSMARTLTRVMYQQRLEGVWDPLAPDSEIPKIIDSIEKILADAKSNAVPPKSNAVSPNTTTTSESNNLKTLLSSLNESYQKMTSENGFQSKHPLPTLEESNMNENDYYQYIQEIAMLETGSESYRPPVVRESYEVAAKQIQTGVELPELVEKLKTMTAEHHRRLDAFVAHTNAQFKGTQRSPYLDVIIAPTPDTRALAVHHKGPEPLVLHPHIVSPHITLFLHQYLVSLEYNLTSPSRTALLQEWLVKHPELIPYIVKFAQFHEQYSKAQLLGEPLPYGDNLEQNYFHWTVQEYLQHYTTTGRLEDLRVDRLMMLSDLHILIWGTDSEKQLLKQRRVELQREALISLRNVIKDKEQARQTSRSPTVFTPLQSTTEEEYELLVRIDNTLLLLPPAIEDPEVLTVPKVTPMPHELKQAYAAKAYLPSNEELSEEQLHPAGAAIKRAKDKLKPPVEKEPEMLVSAAKLPDESTNIELMKARYIQHPSVNPPPSNGSEKTVVPKDLLPLAGLNPADFDRPLTAQDLTNQRLHLLQFDPDRPHTDGNFPYDWADDKEVRVNGVSMKTDKMAKLMALRFEVSLPELLKHTANNTDELIEQDPGVKLARMVGDEGLIQEARYLCSLRGMNAADHGDERTIRFFEFMFLKQSSASQRVLPRRIMLGPMAQQRFNALSGNADEEKREYNVYVRDKLVSWFGQDPRKATFDVATAFGNFHHQPTSTLRRTKLHLSAMNSTSDQAFRVPTPDELWGATNKSLRDIEAELRFELALKVPEEMDTILQQEKEAFIQDLEAKLRVYKTMQRLSPHKQIHSDAETRTASVLAGETGNEDPSYYLKQIEDETMESTTITAGEIGAPASSGIDQMESTGVEQIESTTSGIGQIEFTSSGIDQMESTGIDQIESKSSGIDQTEYIDTTTFAVPIQVEVSGAKNVKQPRRRIDFQAAAASGESLYAEGLIQRPVIETEVPPEFEDANEGEEDIKKGNEDIKKEEGDIKKAEDVKPKKPVVPEIPGLVVPIFFKAKGDSDVDAAARAQRMKRESQSKSSTKADGEEATTEDKAAEKTPEQLDRETDPAYVDYQRTKNYRESKQQWKKRLMASLRPTDDDQSIPLEALKDLSDEDSELLSELIVGELEKNPDLLARAKRRGKRTFKRPNERTIVIRPKTDLVEESQFREGYGADFDRGRWGAALKHNVEYLNAHIINGTPNCVRLVCHKNVILSLENFYNDDFPRMNVVGFGKTSMKSMSGTTRAEDGALLNSTIWYTPILYYGNFKIVPNDPNSPSVPSVLIANAITILESCPERNFHVTGWYLDLGVPVLPTQMEPTKRAIPNYLELESLQHTDHRPSVFDVINSEEGPTRHIPEEIAMTDKKRWDYLRRGK